MLISCLLLHLHFHQMRKEKLSKRPEVLKDSLLVKKQCALPRQVPPTQSFTPAQLRERKFRSHLGIKKKDLQTWSSPQHCRTNTFVPDLSHLQGQWLVMYLLLQCTPRAYFTLGFSTYKQRDLAVEFPSLGSWRCKKLTRDQEQTGQVCKKKTWAHTVNTWKAVLSQKGLLSC